MVHIAVELIYTENYMFNGSVVNYTYLS